MEKKRTLKRDRVLTWAKKNVDSLVGRQFNDWDVICGGCAFALNYRNKPSEALVREVLGEIGVLGVKSKTDNSIELRYMEDLDRNTLLDQMSVPQRLKMSAGCERNANDWMQNAAQQLAKAIDDLSYEEALADLQHRALAAVNEKRPQLVADAD